jgi:choline dehydrogenase-like flavoprotein
MLDKNSITGITSGLFQFLPLIPSLISVLINLWVNTADKNSLKNQMWKKEYDFIIIGGGSAGSLIANRLAQEQGYRVLLLEAGGNENFLSEIPTLSISLQQTSLNWGYVTEPQANACLDLQNRQSRWPRGRVIDGSSAMDYMLYFNGNPNDFNEWERNGAKGWSWSDVRQHFPIVESDNLNVRLSKEDIQH